MSAKRLVIVGASGMVGGHALRYALDTGVVPEAELRAITVDYTIEFARFLRGGSPHASFSFLSGSGADPTGRSRMPYARYKGEAENALLAAGFPGVYIFRPAYIYPVEPRKEPNLSYRILRVVYPAFRVLFPNQVIRSDDLARVMVDAVVRGTPERSGPIFEKRDIRAIVGRPEFGPRKDAQRRPNSSEKPLGSPSTSEVASPLVRSSSTLRRPSSVATAYST